MIDEKIAAKINMPPIRKYHHPTRDWYETFLIHTDYVVTKASEAQLLGESIEDYSDILEARKIARRCINEIDNGTYTGEEAMQEIEVAEITEPENVVGYEYVDGK